MSNTHMGFVTLFSALVTLSMISIHAKGNSDPANPAAPAPAIHYQSAFTGYQPYSEEKISSWREVNDQVTIVGGHVGALKNNNDATSQPSAPDAPQQLHKHGATPKE